MATALTALKEAVAGTYGGRWWEVEICCARSRQLTMLERLLPPGFAFYVRETRADNPEMVRVFVPEERTSPNRFATAFFSLVMESRDAGVEPPEIAWRLIDSWSLPESVKQRWPTQEVGERILVLPVWAPEPQNSERVVVRIDPRFGFGDARHPTTALCLEALETHLANPARTSQIVLADIGCGSGILGVSAIALGAAKVHAMDTDAAAVRSANENRDLNDIGVEQLVVEQGSLERLQRKLRTPVDGFLCNVFADVILKLMPDFHRISHARTWGVLSGVREPDVPRLTWKLIEAGWSITAVTQRESWCCLDIKRSS